MSCKKESNKGCCKCRKKDRTEEKKMSFIEIPGQMIEAKNQIQKEVKKQVGGTAMKSLIKFLFKLIFRVALGLATTFGVLYALNKFAPDTLDSLVDWLKEQRDD